MSSRYFFSHVPPSADDVSLVPPPTDVASPMSPPNGVGSLVPTPNSVALLHEGVDALEAYPGVSPIYSCW